MADNILSGNVPEHLKPGAVGGNKMNMKYKITKAKNGKFQIVDVKSGDVIKAFDSMPSAMKGMKAIYNSTNQEEWSEEQDVELEAQLALDPEISADLGDAPDGDFLIVDDKGQHLRVKVNGKPNPRLMGAAWAALTSNHRGNPYEGSGKDEAMKKLKALYASQKMTPPGEANQEEKLFVFTELVAEGKSVDLDYIKAIDGLAAGTFTAMNGEEVTFKPNELEAYVRNTKEAIAHTQTESGQVVGLPIDMDGHDHKGGAGWLVDLSVDKTRNIIRFVINWTDEGVKVIRGNLRRFFSPSTDPESKVILGGSLTNQPGTRNSKGHMLLRPIELSQSMKGIDMTKTLEELQADNEKLTTSIAELTTLVKALAPKPPVDGDTTHTSPEMKELLGSPDALDKIGELATKRAEEMIAVERRKSHVVDFVSDLVGGTKDHPVGFPIKAADMVALLLSLPEKQAMATEKMFKAMAKGAIDFTERGFAQDNFLTRKPLPAQFLGAARMWVGAKKDIKEFFKANPELGKAEDYDLREFVQVEA
jgi:hypothetical protein